MFSLVWVSKVSRVNKVITEFVILGWTVPLRLQGNQFPPKERMTSTLWEHTCEDSHDGKAKHTAHKKTVPKGDESKADGSFSPFPSFSGL